MRFLSAILLLFSCLRLLAAYSTPGIQLRPLYDQLLTDDGGSTYYLQVYIDGLSLDTNAEFWVIDRSTNGGSTWFHESGDVTAISTTFMVMDIPQTSNTIFRAYVYRGAEQSANSTNLTVWGEMGPRDQLATGLSSNSVWLTFQTKSISEAGFEIQRGSNSTFTGTVLYSNIGPANVLNTWINYTNTGGYNLAQTYYWRIRATNGSLSTLWSDYAFCAPNALPPPASAYGCKVGLTGIDLIWYRPAAGFVEYWYAQRSDGNTNSFATVYAVTNNAAKIEWTDTALTPGTHYFYRVMSSNSVGIAYTITKEVVAPYSIAGAYTFYIDGAAAGDASGTNWANAWPNFASVAWGNISPGATIWIAKGTYHEMAYCNDVAGTAVAPITFRVAQDAPHTGLVYLDSIQMFRGYVQWSGAKSDSFVPKDVEDITNNINLVVGYTNVARPIYASVDPGQGISLKWIEISTVANPEWWYAQDPDVNIGEGIVTGIYCKSETPPYVDNEVAYVWIHDSEAGGIWFAMANPTNWTAVNLHHCLIQRCRSDMMIGNGGDYHDNLFLDEWRPVPSSAPGVHADGMQMWPPYLRIYNNVIRNTTGQALYMELVKTNMYGCHIYNNVCYSTGGVPYTNGTVSWKDVNAGIAFSTEPAAEIAIMTMSNVVIANNTFYGFSQGYLTVTRREGYADILRLRDWVVANNLFYDVGLTSQQDLSTNEYNTAQVVFDFNAFCGTNSKCDYMGTNYATPAALAAATGFNSNTAFTPAFNQVGYHWGMSSNYDFTLTSNDFANLRGTNLASLESQCPGISRNLDGTTRSITGWPIGAFSNERYGRRLLLWYPFTDNFTGQVTNSSGYANHGLKYSATNWPWTTNLGGKTAAAFIKDPDFTDGGFYGIGQYVAITNLATLRTLSNATIAAWARYFPAKDNNYVYAQTATILSCDVNNYGGWYFGRNSSSDTRFLIITNDGGANLTKLLEFNDAAPTGNTTNWHHYAVTFDGSQVIGYFDGVAFATNETYGIKSLNIGGPSDPEKWLGVSCWPHGGTPEFLDDSYPNAGWFHGAMNELRIYEQTLGPADVAALAGASYSGGGSSPTRTANAVTVHVGTMTQPTP